ncbi:type VI secretion system-associated protein TagF [Pseudomonas sp. LRF_L74]|uniref:type VI secretion system-associated protein TagF n=1 Tax=Pseudomonas sp. LRF_L74 TaxID=3369422 RepID=UPI003F63CEBF
MSTPGFYGKLASRGDFIHRGLAPEFIAAWDGWLAASIAASQDALGERWLDAYLVSPLWRFALAPGVLGAEVAVGVMMPSIDRVGRYYPLTIVQTLPAETDIAVLATGSDDWFERVEALLLSTLEEGADFEAFEVQVSTLGSPRVIAKVPPVMTASGGIRMASASSTERAQALARLACEGCSLWWGQGSANVEPGLVRFQGMPPVNAFSVFIGEQPSSLAERP